jgi:uncharacterized protein YuzE
MRMVVEYDTEADATYVQLPGYDETKADRTVEIVQGLVTVDVDRSGAPLGVELLCAPADVDEAMLAALVQRFRALDVASLRVALSGHSLTHA